MDKGQIETLFDLNLRDYPTGLLLVFNKNTPQQFFAHVFL